MRNKYTLLDLYVEAKHLTYKEFGEVVGMHWRTLYGIIKGLNPPGKKAIRKIEAFYDKNQEEIITTISQKETHAIA